MRTFSRMLCGSLLGVAVVLGLMQVSALAQTGGSAVSEAKKRITGMQTELKALKAEQQKMREQMRTEFEEKDEWKNTAVRHKKAKAAYEAAKKQALAATKATPEYKQTVKERDALQVKLDELQTKTGRNADPDALTKIGSALAEKGIAIKKMEQAAMQDDEKAAVAKEEFDAARKEMSALDEAVEDALLSDPDYEAMVTKIEESEKQIADAREQLIQQQKSANASKAKKGSGPGGMMGGMPKGMKGGKGRRGGY